MISANLKKQLIDQPAHFIAGFVLVLLLGLPVSLYVAAFIVGAFAVGREIKQRLDKGNKWYACKWGCRLDLLFWLMGIILAVSLFKIGVL